MIKIYILIIAIIMTGCGGVNPKYKTKKSTPVSDFKIDYLKEQEVVFDVSNAKNTLSDGMSVYVKVDESSAIKDKFHHLRLGKGLHSADEIYISKFKEILHASGEKLGFRITNNEKIANHNLEVNFTNIKLSQYSIPEEYLKKGSYCISKFELEKRKSTEHTIKNVFALDGTVDYKIVNKKDKKIVYKRSDRFSRVNSTVSFSTIENFLQIKSKNRSRIQDEYVKYLIKNSTVQYTVNKGKHNKRIITKVNSKKIITDKTILKLFKDHIININDESIVFNKPMLFVIKPKSDVYALKTKGFRNIAYRRALINMAESSALGFIDDSDKYNKNSYETVAIYKLKKTIPVSEPYLYNFFVVKLKANTKAQYENAIGKSFLVYDKNTLIARIYAFDKKDGFIYGYIRNTIDGFRVKKNATAKISYSENIVSIQNILKDNIEGNDGTLLGIGLFSKGNSASIKKKQEGDLALNILEPLSTNRAFDLALNIYDDKPEIRAFAARGTLHKGKMLEYIPREKNELAFILSGEDKKFGEVCTEINSDDYVIYKQNQKNKTTTVIHSNVKDKYITDGEKYLFLSYLRNKYNTKYFKTYQRNYYNYRTSAFHTLWRNESNFSNIIKQKLNADLEINNLLTNSVANVFFNDFTNILKEEYSTKVGAMSLKSHQKRMKKLEKLLDFKANYKDAKNIDLNEYKYAVMTTKMQILILLASEEGYGIKDNGMPDYEKMVELYFRAYPSGIPAYKVGYTKQTASQFASNTILIAYSFEFTKSKVYMPYAFLFTYGRMEHTGLLNKIIANQKQYIYTKKIFSNTVVKIDNYLLKHPINKPLK